MTLSGHRLGCGCGTYIAKNATYAPPAFLRNHDAGEQWRSLSFDFHFRYPSAVRLNWNVLNLTNVKISMISHGMRVPILLLHEDECFRR